MAFKFVLLGCFLAMANASFIHGPSMSLNSHFGTSSSQYNIAQEQGRYPTTTGPNSQGSSSQSAENIIRGHSNGQTHQKTVQISSGGSSYSSANQEKSDVHVTNPGTYASNNYNRPSNEDGANHEQQITYSSTPSYNNNNNNNIGYQHSVSAASQYQQSTPVYGHSNNAGTVYAHHSIPVYQYVTSAYGVPSGSSFHHNGNSYLQQGSSASSSGGHIIGVPYSPAVAVSHMSYSSPVGISYTW